MAVILLRGMAVAKKLYYSHFGEILYSDFLFFFIKKKINFDNIFTIFYIKTGIILLSCLYFFIFGKRNVFNQVHINVSYIFPVHVQ